MPISIFPNGTRKAIARLPPYPSLLVLAVPLAIVEPLKLAAVFVGGAGHVITGALVMVCAYTISLVVTERLFAIVRPKLLELPWFAAIWRPFVAIRGRVLRRLRGLFGARRTGLWRWEDGQ
jgi:hypothetical protein